MKNLSIITPLVTLVILNFTQYINAQALEQLQRSDYIFNQLPVSMNTPTYQSQSKDKVNAIIPDFQVNDDSGSADQRYPSISTDGGGNFVITWWDYRNGDFDIYAQRYSSDGSGLGINFKVNDDPGSSYQDSPSISTDSGGNFVITWWDLRNGNADIYAQRYSSDGSGLGPNFKVNDDPGGAEQRYPSISTDGSGNFVITWEDGRNVAADIYAQRYSSNGSALDNNFMVTNTSEGSQRDPDVKLWSGRIYNTWKDDRTGSTGDDIWANVLDWNNPIGISDKELSQVPSELILGQNYPNPFNPTTTIEFSLPHTDFVTLKIYNILGEEVATLVSEKLHAGRYKYEWDAGELVSGIYFYQLRAGDFTQTHKMILLK